MLVTVTKRETESMTVAGSVTTITRARYRNTMETCPICKEDKDEMGECQHGTRMCADCWYWFNAPCCGGEDWDGKPQAVDA